MQFTEETMLMPANAALADSILPEDAFDYSYAPDDDFPDEDEDFADHDDEADDDDTYNLDEDDDLGEPDTEDTDFLGEEIPDEEED